MKAAGKLTAGTVKLTASTVKAASKTVSTTLDVTSKVTDKVASKALSATADISKVAVKGTEGSVGASFGLAKGIAKASAATVSSAAKATSNTVEFGVEGAYGVASGATRVGAELVGAGAHTTAGLATGALKTTSRVAKTALATTGNAVHATEHGVEFGLSTSTTVVSRVGSTGAATSAAASDEIEKHNSSSPKLSPKGVSSYPDTVRATSAAGDASDTWDVTNSSAAAKIRANARRAHEESRKDVEAQLREVELQQRAQLGDADAIKELDRREKAMMKAGTKQAKADAKIASNLEAEAAAQDEKAWEKQKALEREAEAAAEAAAALAETAWGGDDHVEDLADPTLSKKDRKKVAQSNQSGGDRKASAMEARSIKQGEKAMKKHKKEMAALEKKDKANYMAMQKLAREERASQEAERTKQQEEDTAMIAQGFIKTKEGWVQGQSGADFDHTEDVDNAPPAIRHHSIKWLVMGGIMCMLMIAVVLLNVQAQIEEEEGPGSASSWYGYKLPEPDQEKELGFLFRERLSSEWAEIVDVLLFLCAGISTCCTAFAMVYYCTGGAEEEAGNHLQRVYSMTLFCAIGFSSMMLIAPTTQDLIEQHLREGNSWSCKIQGAGIAYFQLASVAWFTAAAYSSYAYVVCRNMDLALKYHDGQGGFHKVPLERVYHLLCWGIPFVFAGIMIYPSSPAVLTFQHVDRYGFCWVGSQRPGWVFGLFYAPVVFAMYLIASMYFFCFEVVKEHHTYVQAFQQGSHVLVQPETLAELDTGKQICRALRGGLLAVTITWCPASLYGVAVMMVEAEHKDVASLTSLARYRLIVLLLVSLFGCFIWLAVDNSFQYTKRIRQKLGCTRQTTGVVDNDILGIDNMRRSTCMVCYQAFMDFAVEQIQIIFYLVWGLLLWTPMHVFSKDCTNKVALMLISGGYVLCICLPSLIFLEWIPIMQDPIDNPTHRDVIGKMAVVTFMALVCTIVTSALRHCRYSAEFNFVQNPRRNMRKNTSNSIIIMSLLLIENFQLSAILLTHPQIVSKTGADVYKVWLADIPGGQEPTDTMFRLKLYAMLACAAFWVGIVAVPTVLDNIRLGKSRVYTNILGRLSFLQQLISGPLYLILLLTMLSTLMCTSNVPTELDENLHNLTRNDVTGHNSTLRQPFNSTWNNVTGLNSTSRQPPPGFYMTLNPSQSCWEGDHYFFAAVGLTALVAVIPLATLTAEESLSTWVDVRMPPFFTRLENFVKVLMVICVTVFHSFSPLLSFLAVGLLALYMCRVIQQSQPCCVLWVNSLKLCGYLMQLWAVVVGWVSFVVLPEAHIEERTQFDDGAKVVLQLVVWPGWAAIMFFCMVRWARHDYVLFRPNISEDLELFSEAMNPVAKDEFDIDPVGSTNSKDRFKIQRQLKKLDSLTVSDYSGQPRLNFHHQILSLIYLIQDGQTEEIRYRAMMLLAVDVVACHSAQTYADGKREKERQLAESERLLGVVRAVQDDFGDSLLTRMVRLTPAMLSDVIAQRFDSTDLLGRIYIARICSIYVESKVFASRIDELIPPNVWVEQFMLEGDEHDQELGYPQLLADAVCVYLKHLSRVDPGCLRAFLRVKGKGVGGVFERLAQFINPQRSSLLQQRSFCELLSEVCLLPDVQEAVVASGLVLSLFLAADQAHAMLVGDSDDAKLHEKKRGLELRLKLEPAISAVAEQVKSETKQRKSRSGLSSPFDMPEYCHFEITSATDIALHIFKSVVRIFTELTHNEVFRKDFFQEVGLEWLFNLYSGGDRDSKVLVIRFLRELATKPTSLDDLIENEEMLEIYTELLEFQHASEPGTSFVISGQDEMQLGRIHMLCDMLGLKHGTTGAKSRRVVVVTAVSDEVVLANAAKLVVPRDLTVLDLIRQKILQQLFQGSNAQIHLDDFYTKSGIVAACYSHDDALREEGIELVCFVSRRATLTTEAMDTPLLYYEKVLLLLLDLQEKEATRGNITSADWCVLAAAEFRDHNQSMIEHAAYLHKRLLEMEAAAQKRSKSRFGRLRRKRRSQPQQPGSSSSEGAFFESKGGGILGKKQKRGKKWVEQQRIEMAKSSRLTEVEAKIDMGVRTADRGLLETEGVSAAQFSRAHATDGDQAHLSESLDDRF